LAVRVLVEMLPWLSLEHALPLLSIEIV